MFSSVQGQFCPEIVSRHQEVLEARYGGRFVAHRAAAVIQRAFRSYRLRAQFTAALSLARSEDTNSLRRRSILLSDDFEAAGGYEVAAEFALTSAAARHINNRRRQPPVLNRSSSLRDHRRSGSWSGGFEPILPEDEAKCELPERAVVTADASSALTQRQRPQTAADLQNQMNQARDERLLVLPPSPAASPVPPCPPLRGEGFYEPSYLSRDSLYCSVRRPRRLPPRPPARTVSFLGEAVGTVCGQAAAQTLSDSSLPRPQPTYDSCSSLRSAAGSDQENQQQLYQQPPEHSRRSLPPPEEDIYVQPSNLIPLAPARPVVAQPLGRNGGLASKRSPLPPPPYIPPPGVRDEPLPPPPTDLGLERKPCDSVSSIDSGFRSSCSESTSSAEADTAATPTSPHLPPPPLHLPASSFSEIPEDPYSYWVSSPAFNASPDVYSASSDSLSTRPACATACACDCQPRRRPSPPRSLNCQYSDCDLQRRRRVPDISGGGRTKKTVRIQLPSSSSLPLEDEELLEDGETIRRRNYRVGLNLFNSSPETGITYLARKDFIDLTPPAVAKFLVGRKGLSKRVVGEYICSLQKPFNLAVLQCMIQDMDFTGLHLDIALRQLLTEVHIPGEAQKIEKLVEVFARRYIECNQMFVAGFKAADTIFILAYAMVLLNTDLHNKSIKPERRMRVEDFLRNLRGIDAGRNVDEDMLRGIYDRIKAAEFKEGPDHVSQVAKVQETISGAKRPGSLAASWRRLVCFCRVAEVADINKKDKKEAHQRGIFLFNDMLVVTKTEKSRGGGAGKHQMHAYRHSLQLSGLRVNVYRTAHHQFGVQLQSRTGRAVVATFACRSYNDQQRFVSDLQESIAEVEEMERARLFL